MPIEIIFIGESNSSQRADNSAASPSELGVRDVLFLNNVTLAVEPLNIGVNNALLEIPARDLSATRHGFELAIANDVDLYHNFNPILLQAGVGGTTVAEWGTAITTGYFSPTGYFTNFVNRHNSLISQINPNHRRVVFMSIGLNDVAAGTTMPTFKTRMATYISDLRNVLGQDTPIIMTKFMSSYSALNTALDEIATANTNVYTVLGSDAAVRPGDTDHFNYAGLKLVTGRMLDKVYQLY